MNDFKLPVIRKPQTPKRVLSMDEYLEFVQFNMRHAFNRRAYEKRKRMTAVNAAFSL